MQNFFKYLILLVLFMIIFLVIFLFYSNIRNKKIYHKHNKLQKWQKDRLLLLIQNRIKRINVSGKTICDDEKNVLDTIIKNINQLDFWEDLDKLTNDTRTCSIVNIAIMDDLYLSEIDTVESKNKFLQNLFLLDCVNEGISFDGKNPIFFPENIDIKETLKLIINNQKELTSTQSEILTGFVANAWKEKHPESYEEFKKEYIYNDFKNIISDSAIEKTLSELINKKYIKDLSKPARLVISKIIIEILSNIIYSSNNYEKLSENAKIYTRILSIVIANESYEKIYEKFNKIQERRK